MFKIEAYMFKTLFFRIRGSAASAAKQLAGRNALPILDRRMRDARTERLLM
jgi:hypothetical protein